ncbi:MAG: DUF6279 family lipoprotein, partial [Ramlibacter sp.]
MLSGCNALKLAYNNLPEVAYWWLDGYADFDDAQTRRVREDLVALHDWHRTNELPRWLTLLAQMEQLALQDVSAAQVCSFVPALRRSVSSVAAQSEPFIVAFGASMSSAQLAYLDRKYRRNNMEFRREWVELPADELQEKRYKQALGRSERLYGSLDGEQQGELRRQVALTPFDPSGALEQRQQRQQAIRQMLLGLSVHRGTMEEARLIPRTTLDGLLDSSMLSETSGRDAALQQACRS